MNSVIKLLNDYGYEDVVVFDNPSYDTAFIGVTFENNAVYDYQKMIEYLITELEMTEEEAADFIQWNYSFSPKPGIYPLILDRLE